MKDLFSTCPDCVVREWCKLRSGEVKLPPDYMLTFCVGYEKLKRALELARIPTEYLDANLYHYQVDEDNKDQADVIIEILQRPVGFVQSGMNAAFIHPNKGTGKTWSAIAILNEFIYKVCRDPEWFDYENPVGLYVKFGAWANRQRDIYTLDDEDFAYQAHLELQRMKEVPLLVLDDIGSGRITPIIRDLLYDVIDYRKEEKKSTIFTTNFTREELEDDSMLGEMIVSRLFYNTIEIPLGGRDRRAEKIYKY